MGLALYRKYRPKSLDDVVGQEHIVTSLKKAIASNTVSHAYLLTGPRGVGKTSIARILAHELNGLSYDDTTNHLDIIEIDAASNRRIDEIRDLRDKVHIAPTSSKYKVYIIDEVHMLTREAFNALLKTLEEPPAHVIFILATTEAHKVPDTIISRTQRYNFKPITSKDTVHHLAAIAKKEKIFIDEAALELLAEHAGGSFRDSINLLDQLAGSKDAITTSDVVHMLGIPQDSLTGALSEALQNKSPKDVLLNLDSARSEGVQAVGVARHLLTTMRTAIVECTLEPTDNLMTLLDGLAKVGTAVQPYLQLELTLLRFVSVGEDTNKLKAVSEVPASYNDTAKTHKVAEEPKLTTPVKIAKSETTKPVLEPFVTVKQDTVPKRNASSNDYWQELLSQIKAKHNTLYSMLRMAQPDLSNDVLTLTFGFSFHHKQITQAANLQLISDAISNILKKSTQVVCVINKSKDPTQSPQKATTIVTKTHLSDVANIFNGAELIE